MSATLFETEKKRLERLEEWTPAMLDFLRQEIARRALPVRLNIDAVSVAGNFVRIPAYIDGDFDVWDRVQMLQDIEDAWNDQEPQPDVMAFLQPTGRMNGA